MKPDLPTTCFTWPIASAAAIGMEELKKAREKLDLLPWGLHKECPLDPGNDSGADEGDTQSHCLWSADSMESLRPAREGRLLFI